MTTFAMVQSSPVPGQLKANTEELLGSAQQELQGEADVVVFPELAASGYVTNPKDVTASAQPLDGPLIESLTRVTQRHGGLVAAGYAESADGEHYNSVALVGPDGPVMNYRKVHLFDTEWDGFVPGDDVEIGGIVFELDPGAPL